MSVRRLRTWTIPKYVVQYENDKTIFLIYKSTKSGSITVKTVGIGNHSIIVIMFNLSLTMSFSSSSLDTMLVRYELSICLSFCLTQVGVYENILSITMCGAAEPL